MKWCALEAQLANVDAMEICVDSLQSALNAESGGAVRVELCSSLEVGGVTPSTGLIQKVKENLRIPVFILIRPRAGDFLYTELELETMMSDINAAKTLNIDGFVLGILTKEGLVDEENSKRLISACKPQAVTFHRAVDMCENPLDAVETIVRLGCETILTSGGHSDAFQGRQIIRQMNEKAAKRLVIMPGGGVNENNLSELLTDTGCTRFHSSAKTTVDSEMNYRNPKVAMGVSGPSIEFSRWTCDPTKVRKMTDILQQAKIK